MNRRTDDKQSRIVHVLVASPSDVAAERKIADEVIRTWHIRHQLSGLRLEPVLWESHGAPECGDRVQGILNKQIVDECDCAIGIFWTRIGTDTGVAPGGAVEEVQRLMSKGKPVMLYFSKANYPLNLSDSGKVMEFAGQLTRLAEFKASLQGYSLLWEYDSQDRFRQNLLTHLDIQIPKWFGPEATAQERVVVSPKLDAASALKRYHSTLARQLGNITLTGSPVITNFSAKLSDTFVSLSLSGTSRCETRIHAADEPCVSQTEERTSTPEEVMRFVFQNYPLLLVIGDPGSGKTTLLKYYALSCLDNGRCTQFGFSEDVNVFYFPLRELKKGDSGYASLPAILSGWCEKNYLTLPDTLFSGWLEEPSSLVLLDGLDEISDVDERIAVCSWVDRMVERFTSARFVVTSRSTGYRKGDGIELEASHLRADIMDFSKEQQAEFLQRWFKAAFLGEIPPSVGDKGRWRILQEQKADQKADAIIAFLSQDKNRSLRALAGVPLLLQIMAMLWKDREYLPGSRLKLYDAALNYMLDYRDRRRGIDPLLAAEDARRVLSPVSLWMQDELKKDEADRDKMQDKMQELLDTLCNSLPASEFCRNLVDRAGLLVEYGEKEYVFRHKSFREYMAGVQLLKNMHRMGYLDIIVTRFGDDWWQEPLRFFIGHVDDADVFDSFMQKLFDSPVTENLTQKQQDLLVALVEEAPQRKIDALRQKLLDPATTQNRQRYLLECLKTIAKPEALAVVREFKQLGLSKEERVIVAVTLDKLGAEYILIKGGTFIYSRTKKPETVPDMYVAKYTVTNQHYRRFIDYLDAKEPEFAERVPVETYRKSLQELASGIKGFSNWLKEEPSLVSRFRSFYDDDKRFNKDEQPVVGVSWFAAKAWCLWLSLLEGERARYQLPDEVQWEWAAGGQRDKRDEVLKVRDYPWPEEKGKPDKTRANYNNHEGGTTPVGRYPEGATPEGLYDMAGNVWEWTEDWYDEDKDRRSLRGGDYSDKADALRCSSRLDLNPRNRGYFIGFRVIRSSHSSSS
ncbi:NACHT domain-containing protein [Pelodictyon phaeoclathratiforme]|uniref:Putative signal transduction protein with Nacht domain n=1 Tax=Pelodictyon phaeoclathratiforme (strain DSM 5477 / BU-1) TaxID=324925 RepID=B4SAB6_PELPB|nr:SUMF1/EgtB/PvdO family nonheme iron enzyme [Pelodictyon phaeoclathratiforme]ACF43802.1 putative signal transduction protein with Nacht domain [Pelodictyon phaeoclathratiforme BU-1]